MATNGKILATALPAAGSNTTLYTVPSTVTYSVVNLYLANISGSNDSFNLALVPSGATLSSANYIVYNVTIPPGGAMDLNNIAIGSGSSIIVSTVNGNISTVATGLEVS